MRALRPLAILALLTLDCLPVFGQEHPEEATTPPAPQDSTSVISAYDAAIDALLEGDLDAAVSGFDHVRQHSVDPTRRMVAEELARKVRELKTRAPATQPAPTPSITAPPTKTARTSQGARSLLLGGSTLLGLGFYGWALPTALDVESDKGKVGMYMLTAGSSFAIPYLVTRKAPVTYGTTVLGLYGATRGIPAGLALYFAATGDADEADGDLDPGSDEALIGTMMATSIAGGVAGSVYAGLADLSPGNAHDIENGGDFGALFGLYLSVVTQLDENPGSKRWMPALTLATGSAGLLLGKWYSETSEHNYGDAEVMRMAGALGIFAAGVPLLWVEPDDEEVIANVLMLGGIGGLTAGHYLLAGKEFSFGRGLLVDLGTIAGGLTAAGLTYLLLPSDTDHRGDIIMTTAALGASAGFGLMFYSLGDAGDEDEQASTLPLQVFPLVGNKGERGLAVGGMF